MWVHQIYIKKLELGIFSPAAVQFLPNAGYVSVSMVTMCMGLVALNQKFSISAFISERKISAVTPGHWSPTDENGTCGIQTLDSARLVGLTRLECTTRGTRLCWYVRFPARCRCK
jgi:hypothetical protein